MICPDCRNAELIEKKETIRYEESGLSNVALQGILIRQCPDCGNKLVSIPNLAGLHRAIAMVLVNKPERLVAEEIRFLRKSLGWSKADFAKKFHVRLEQVSRWESEANPKQMQVQNELLLRAIVAKGQKIQDYEEHMEEIASIEPCGKSFLSMFFDHKKWQSNLPLCHC
ncbi:MAG: helix-turn-helix domain-containing protein [Desulfuromonadales bacterium]|nr:helix-turn-helix domain-containing protein [Desulfuromonadales bacterium]MBN2791868.1 helix-turn-helix domain-containing protein [Desulfuromonadales bacterium]